jgi:hypothetical protein
LLDSHHAPAAPGEMEKRGAAHDAEPDDRNISCHVAHVICFHASMIGTDWNWAERPQKTAILIDPWRCDALLPGSCRTYGRNDDRGRR